MSKLEKSKYLLEMEDIWGSNDDSNEQVELWREAGSIFTKFSAKL